MNDVHTTGSMEEMWILFLMFEGFFLVKGVQLGYGKGGRVVVFVLMYLHRNCRTQKKDVNLQDLTTSVGVCQWKR